MTSALSCIDIGSGYTSGTTSNTYMYVHTHTLDKWKPSEKDGSFCYWTNTMQCHHSNVTQAWWLHLMELFSALVALCEGNPPVTGGFPPQRPVRGSFDNFVDLRLKKRLSKQSRRRWFETASRSSWYPCNEMVCFGHVKCTFYMILNAQIHSDTFWPPISKMVGVGYH